MIHKNKAEPLFSDQELLTSYLFATTFERWFRKKILIII